MDNSIETELKSLLYNFWIIKDENPELYYQIKYNQNKIKEFITKNLGSNLIIHDRFIKLEKIPSIIKANSKISLFNKQLDYVILMIILIFLEDKARGEIFILSDLVEYIKNTAITLELDHIPDWNKVSDRRSFINVIEFLKEIHAIKVKDENKISFTEDKNAEALYETQGISNYIMRMFNENINDLITPEDFIKSEFIYQDEEKGDIRRYKVFRNILYTPSVSSRDINPSELDYIKKNRNYIKSEIDKHLNMEVEITNNLTIAYEHIDSNEKDNFPNTKKLTEIVLMVNAKILEDINMNKILLDNYETCTVKESYLSSIIKEIKKTKEPYIGKTYLKLTDDKFYNEVLDFMEKYNIIEKTGDELIIYPNVSRLIGKTLEVENNSIEQISLLEDNDE